MIHEWEENRAKGKREEERIWESGDEGGESVAEREDERDILIGMREKDEKKNNKPYVILRLYQAKIGRVL